MQKLKKISQCTNTSIKLATLLFIVVSVLGLSACDLSANKLVSQSKLNNKLAQQSLKKNGKNQKQLWGRLRNNFTMQEAEKNVSAKAENKVQKYVQKYQRQPKSLARVTTQATPYLYFIVEELEKRDMPGELALLPIIESAFKPQATSRRGAAGIWQFIPSTGRLYGLKQDRFYDGRRDVLASTRAALDYLQFLHKEFDNNWMLALAAYNSGEGTVRRAIARNRRLGKPTTFWDLKLPGETREYVPQFLALAEVINDPNKYAIELPSIDNQPYLKLVNPGKHLNFKQAAQLAGIKVAELKTFNACYRRAHTHPKGPQQLLLPIANAEQFETNLAKKR